MMLKTAILFGGLALVATLPAAGVRAQETPATADALFVAGQFAQAGGLYRALVDKDPNDAASLTRLGAIALYSNRLAEAESWLEKAIIAKAGQTEAQVLLAETFYRLDDFQNAARSLEAAGAAAASLPTFASFSTLAVDKLQSFGSTPPYAITAPGASMTLPFIKTDPLPIVRVTVNGREAVFFIDTGGAETIIDTEFAKELGIPQFKPGIGYFAGGQTAPFGSGRIETLGLGDWSIERLPVQIVDTRKFSGGFGVQIDGCIGTVVLSRFLSTLDYGKGELVLQPKSAGLPDPAPAGSVTVPFWLTGDHAIVAFGTVNQLPPALFFVDTGLTSGVNVRQPVFGEAGIVPETDKETKAQGGGGVFIALPYIVDRVTLGDWQETDVPGVYNGPAGAENRFGFYVQGLVGHRFFNPHTVTFDFTAMKMLIR